jgi:phosphoglycolate phosphatase
VALVYDHVVFDLDGTLVDSRVDLTNAVNHVLHAFGMRTLPVTVVSSYVGAGARVLVQRALGAAHQDRLDDGLRLFSAYYSVHLLDHTRAYPGIGELLAALGARMVMLSVLSNKPEAMSRAILAGLGLLPRFVAVLGGDSLVARKPDPAGLESLCTLTGTRRETMLVVGDSAIDMQTARAGRVAFCGVGWGLAPHTLCDEQRQVPRIVTKPMELVEVVEQDEESLLTRGGI